MHAVSGSLDSSVRVWDLHNKKLLTVLDVHMGAIAITQQPSTMNSRSSSARSLSAGPVYGIAISLDGSRALSGRHAACVCARTHTRTDGGLTV